jgi:hypothetical protein
MIRQIMIQIRSLLDVIVQQDERIVLVDHSKEQNMIVVFQLIQMMYEYITVFFSRKFSFRFFQPTNKRPKNRMTEQLKFCLSIIKDLLHKKNLVIQ